MPDIDDKIRFVIPIMLDRVSVELGPWSGYHVLAQHPRSVPAEVIDKGEIDCFLQFTC
jgi:hypothetical protein